MGVTPQSPDRRTGHLELEALPEMSLADLRARWLELKGVPLPKYFRPGFTVRAVAHALQEQTLGGLDPAARKRVEELAAQVVPSGEAPPPKRRKIRAGTRLIREWQGKVHEVTATPDGFLWNGERHRSLSVIARKITGTQWNGWVFFGLTKERSAAASPVKKGKPARKAGVQRGSVGARAKPAHRETAHA